MLNTFLKTLDKMTSKVNKNLNLQEVRPKRGRVERLQKEAEVQDIEDCTPPKCTIVKSPYFSPLQTRRQRKSQEIATAKKPEPPVTGSKVIESKFDTLKVKSVKKAEMKSVKVLENYANTEDTDAIETKQTKASEDYKTSEMEEAGTSGQSIENQWEPENWRKVLDNIREMRKGVVAPVDRMGCDKCSDDSADEKTQRFQKLVSLMLSSQTKDETTFEAMQRLRSHTLTPDSLVNMNTKLLEDLLCPVSFYKHKAKYLQQTSRILIDKYNRDIPNNIKELISLPGVGPKMAHICMSVAWNELTGIGVDVHVHRIANRLGWVQCETKVPEKTRVALENWLPRHLWSEINHLLVGFGQVTCTPVRPHCNECLNQKICPSANKNVKKEKTTKTKAKSTKINSE